VTQEKPHVEEASATQLLRMLRERGDVFVSVAEMGRSLKQTRVIVLRLLRRLRTLGCGLEEDATKGFRLVGVPDSLRPEVVLSSLPLSGWGRPYHAFETIGSTNDLCHSLARSGSSEGTVVVTETQTKGRGRLGRSWHLSEGKGLAFSVLLRPRLSPQRMTLLTLASAVGVSMAIEEFDLKPGIKWPNDVELDGKKICGILTEAQTDPDRLLYAVVGVGINVNNVLQDHPPELRDRAIGLSESLGHPISRISFFQSLLKHLREAHALLDSGKNDKLLREWRSRATVLGRQVRIRQGERTLFGQVLDINDQGALMVRTDWGFTETVTAGDVEQLRLLEPSSKTRRKVVKRPRRL
jgi:BirA family biotin operon repressor/biotin-[acetyl-CoA-carboxylase] ligase